MVKDKIEYIEQTKAAIKAAIIDSGIVVENTDTFRSYADKIKEIGGNIPTETLPEQTVLIAKDLQEITGIKLMWSASTDATGYCIVRKEDYQPKNTTDGTTIYQGTDLTYTDTDAEKGKVYYYRIFPYNSKGQFQTVLSNSVVKVDYIDRSGQSTIDDLSVGDVIKFGSFNGIEMFWTIVDTLDKESGYVTVASNYSLGNFQFDAPENDANNPNPNTDRQSYGNNRWAYSALRQMCNSDSAKGEWWTSQHEYDVAPAYASNYNGVLYEFTDFEKDIILQKTNICRLDTADGGGTETVIDILWCASSYAIGLSLTQPLEDTHIYEYFVDNDSRSFSGNYWLRTQNGNSRSVSIVYSGGTLGSSNANYSNGLRPFCLLPTYAYMQWSDSDSAYIFADDSQRTA